MIYNGEHSVIFGDKHSWKDWHLVPSTRPVFNPPPVKTNYIDIPGSNGVLDLTEVLTGYPLYENRQGSIEFIVANNYGRWSERYTEIMAYLHGKKLQARLVDDQYWMYEGRFNVNEWKSDPNYSLITIDYDVYPFKREPNSSLEKWKWDPFSFVDGVIRNYASIAVNGSYTLFIPGTQDYTIPTIIASGIGGSGLTVRVNNTTYTLKNGNNSFPQMVIKEAGATLVFTGNGTVSVDFRGGKF